VRKDRDTRIKVSVQGLAFTGTAEQAEEIWDYLFENSKDAPVIVTKFTEQLWEQLKELESDGQKKAR